MEQQEGGIVLAIVGSRTFADNVLFEETIQEFIVRHEMPIKVVSGGAKGADTMGENWAKRMGITLQVFKPRWKYPLSGKYDPGAGLKRNTDIIKACTHVNAFPSKKGRGTQDSIRKAKEMGKPCIVKWIE